MASTLVNNPVIIIAEEATGNLDTRTSFELHALFQDLHGAGKTILFVTHNPEMSDFSSRNILLRDGVIIDDTRNDNIKDARVLLAELPKQD